MFLGESLAGSLAGYWRPPTSRGIHVVDAIALLALFAVTPMGARAHGGPPSALGVIAADPSGHPRLVAINEGMALLRDDRWSFVCPRLWGNVDFSTYKAPLALSIDGEESWIVGTGDLYAARDGTLTAQGRPELGSTNVVALTATADALLGLRFSNSGSAVVRIDDPAEPPVFESSEFWSSLAIDTAGERIHLARVTAELELALLVLDRQGRVLDDLLEPAPGVLSRVRLRSGTADLFAVLSSDAGYLLVQRDGSSWREIVESPGSIAGPVESAGGQLWIALQGELMRGEGDRFEATGETRFVTCLDRWQSLAYACVGSEIYRLGDEGLEERLFHLEEFSGPDPDMVPEEAAQDCHFQWLLFRNDLARGGYEPRDWPTTATDTEDAGPKEPDAPDGGAVAPQPSSDRSCGCSAALGGGAHFGPSGFGLAAALACLAFARLRARRACQALPSGSAAQCARRQAARLNAADRHRSCVPG
jgi:hypothetical protein